MSASLVPQTISQAITKDHEELRKLHVSFENAVDSEKETWINRFRWQLARHTIGEVLVLYPAYERFLGEEGKEFVEKEIREHKSISELLRELSKLNPSIPGYLELLLKLIGEVNFHFKDEEDRDLPKLEAIISREESLRLAREFERTKFFAPTSSRPEVPFETVVDLLDAPLEKLKESFASFPLDDNTSLV